MQSARLDLVDWTSVLFGSSSFAPVHLTIQPLTNVSLLIMRVLGLYMKVDSHSILKYVWAR